MNRLQPPQFLSDVYRDLRDRHLLLPALALLVALIAVPMLLSTKSDPVVPAVAPSGDKAAATIPAVLADSEVSVRDYRERLEDLKSKNPFSQQFSSDGGVLGDGTGLGGASAAGIPSASTAPGSDAAPVDPGVSSDVPTLPSTDTTSGDTANGDIEVVQQLYTHRVDVMVGVQGDLKKRKGVKPMTILPNDATPVLAFLGTDEAGKRAAFVVSSDVTSVGGDGACVPSPNCLYITLEKDEVATLDYAPDGQTYELRLRAIRNVKLKTD
jgi:hypothetical protein